MHFAFPYFLFPYFPIRLGRPDGGWGFQPQHVFAAQRRRSGLKGHNISVGPGQSAAAQPRSAAQGSCPRISAVESQARRCEKRVRDRKETTSAAGHASSDCSAHENFFGLGRPQRFRYSGGVAGAQPPANGCHPYRGEELNNATRLQARREFEPHGGWGFQPQQIHPQRAPCRLSAGTPFAPGFRERPALGRCAALVYGEDVT